MPRVLTSTRKIEWENERKMEKKQATNIFILSIAMIATIAARTAARFSRSVNWFLLFFHLLCYCSLSHIDSHTLSLLPPHTATSDVYNILLNHRCVIENHLRSRVRNTFPPFDIYIYIHTFIHLHKECETYTHTHYYFAFGNLFFCILNRNGNFLFLILSHISRVQINENTPWILTM